MLRRLVVPTLVLLMLGVLAPPASAHGNFWDDDDNIHEAKIEAIEHKGITRGCNPPRNDRFCPENVVSRGQMAAFIARALQLPPPQQDHFVDDDGTRFEHAINRIADEGITNGCNPPANDRYCPGMLTARDQMAAFLDRAFVRQGSQQDHFVDDEDNQFEPHINNIAAAGITKGCNPPANDRYCPGGYTARDQMASFLARAMDLGHGDPTPGGAERVITYTVGPNGAPDQGDLDVFGTRVHEALHSQVAMGRAGWNIQQRIRFVPVESGGDMHVWLTDDDDVGDKAPGCSDAWSCRVGDNVYINDDNFANGTDTWRGRSLADYQRYVVNHEVGHYLDFNRRTHYNDPAYCGSGGEAPVMMQQSIDLRGCATNVWPLGWERDCVEETWLADATDQGGVHNGQCPHATG